MPRDGRDMLDEGAPLEDLTEEDLDLAWELGHVPGDCEIAIEQ